MVRFHGTYSLHLDCSNLVFDFWPGAIIIHLNYLLHLLASISDDPLLPLVEHAELDSLLNGSGWDRNLSPLDSNLPTDPDIITLFSSSSSPLSPIVLPDQPSNSLVEEFFQSLKDNPIRFPDNPTVPLQESRGNVLLPSLFGSPTHSHKTPSVEPQYTPPSPRQQTFNSTALIAPAQDARASLSRPIRFEN